METMDSQIAGGATARPAVIPDDVDGPAVMKASGRVRLPLNVRWSGPDVVYDLADRRDRARVYEQVLREGTDDDVRYFIDVDALLDLWSELFLPAHIHAPWARWLREHRGAAV